MLKTKLGNCTANTDTNFKIEMLWKGTKETCSPDVTYSCRHLQNSPKFLQGKIQLTFKECLKYVLFRDPRMVLINPYNSAHFSQGPAQCPTLPLTPRTRQKWHYQVSSSRQVDKRGWNISNVTNLAAWWSTQHKRLLQGWQIILTIHLRRYST